MSAIADRVSIFYAGKVVEAGSREAVLRTPRHPYTRALLDALPHPEGRAGQAARRDRRRAAEPGRDPVRLLLPSPLRVRAARAACSDVPPLRCERRPAARVSRSTRWSSDERARGSRRRRRLRGARRRPRARSRRREPDGRAGPDRRPRRRVRLRQVEPCARGRRARRADRGLGALRRRAGEPAHPPRAAARARAAAARLPEPVLVAQPAAEGRRAARGRARCARPRAAARTRAAGARADRARRAPGDRGRRLPARVLRRPAPADRDRALARRRTRR